MASRRKYPFVKNRRGKQYDWIAWAENSIKQSKKKNEGNEVKLSKKDFVTKWMKENGNIVISDANDEVETKNDEDNTERN